MFGTFYHSSVRNYIVLMGDLFSRINVARIRDGKPSYTRVPLTYASKEHFVMKLNSSNSINNDGLKIETILPRMNLHLVDMQYNAQYKTSTLAGTGILNPQGSTRQYNPVPIKMIFELGIYTRHHDDMFQIVEQILPYFQPHFNTTIREKHNTQTVFERDVRVVIQSISPDEQLDGEANSRRRLEWSIMFEVNGWIYPPETQTNNEIRTIYLDFYSNEIELNPEGEFDSWDYQVDPVKIPKEEWEKTKPIKAGRSKNIPIPKGEEPSKVRGT